MSKVSIKNITESIYEITDSKSGLGLEIAMKNVVKFLYMKKMLSQSPTILVELEKIIDKKESRIRMKVKSAKQITEIRKKELEEEMKEKYKAREIVSEYFEEKDLLGGMRIEIGEDVLDMTYRNKLNQLKKHLKI